VQGGLFDEPTAEHRMLAAGGLDHHFAESSRPGRVGLTTQADFVLGQASWILGPSVSSSSGNTKTGPTARR
jgi:hypothetical protein